MNDLPKRRFAERGIDGEDVLASLSAGRDGDLDWTDPHNLKASYFAGAEVHRVAYEAFRLYMGDNAIYGATLYPSLPRLEAEVVAMTAELLNAPEGAGGSVTIGGTESIVMAVKAARDRARRLRPAVTEPNMVVARSAHVAVDKAGALLGVAVRRAVESPGVRADVDAMREMVDDSTIFIVASAPPYPFGVVDPVADVAAIAEEHDLWMHVDGCVGGFILPFVEELGEPVPVFDFRLPAVTSMSADLHKYGYACRGSSVLVLREAKLLDDQRFSSSSWNAGTYTTTGVAGSRPGGPLASAWAVMKHLGRSGYRERVAGIVAAKKRFLAGIGAIEGLSVWGTPEGGHFTFGSPDGSLDMAAVADGLVARGFAIGRMRDPASVLCLLNYRHGEIADEFLGALRESADEVRAGGRRAGDGEAVYVG